MSNNEFFDTYDLEIEGVLDNNDNNNVIKVDDSISNISPETQNHHRPTILFLIN
jgi:hypothetical protein